VSRRWIRYPKEHLKSIGPKIGYKFVLLLVDILLSHFEYERYFSETFITFVTTLHIN